jgi:parallel beta-helix repeat protein
MVKLVVHNFMPTVQPNLTLPNIYTTTTNQYLGMAALLNIFNENTTNGLVNHSDRYSATRANSYAWPSPSQTFTAIYDSRVIYSVVAVYYYSNDTYFALNDYTSPNALLDIIAAQPGNRLDEGLPIVSGGFHDYDHFHLYNNRPTVSVKLRAGVNYTNQIECQDANRNTLRHELGHAMGWLHPYDSETLDCSDDDWLSDVIPSSNLTCPFRIPSGTVACTPENTVCMTCHECGAYGTNNVMSGSWTADTRWMSPLQIGRRIRNLHLNIGPGVAGYGVRDYAMEAYSDHDLPLEVSTNETWDFDIQMYRDIVVKAPATLKITCRVAMAKGGKIIVQKGAKLIIDGGLVTGWCKKNPSHFWNYGIPLWQGIEVLGDPSQTHAIQSSTGLSTHHGVVVLENNAVISNAVVGINTSSTNSTYGTVVNNTSGGIVMAINSTFENNIYDIIFYKYERPNSKNYLGGCNFITTGAIGRDGYNNLILPKEHIKFYHNRGTTIEGCNFEYSASTTYSVPTLGIGIYSTDSYFTLSRLCASSCANYTPSIFNTLKIGVYTDNVNPIYVPTVNYSEFWNNTYGALMENTDHLLFETNNFVDNNEGMYLFKSKYYTVRDNNFEGHNYNGVGVVPYESQDGSHQVFRNTFSGLNAGIAPIDNNGGRYVNMLGLKMNCNVFNSGEENLFDIAAGSSLTSMPIIMKEQSVLNTTNAKKFVRNLYGAPYNGGNINKFYIENTSTESIHHVNTASGVDNPNYPDSQASSQIFVSQNATNFNYTADCISTFSISNGESLTDNIGNLNDYITSLRTDPEVGLLTENIFEIQNAVSTKLNLFLTDTLPESKDSVLAILENNQGGFEDTDLQMIFALMHYGYYKTALTKIDELPISSDWAALLSKIIELETSDMGLYTLLDDVESTDFITTYANTEGMDGQTCAQAILRFVFDTEHDYPLTLPTIDSERRIFSESPIASVITAQLEQKVKIRPNPTSTSVNVSLPEIPDGVCILIKDVIGREVFIKFTRDSQLDIPVSTLPNGIYLISVKKRSSNEIIYQSKLIKQE